MTEVEMKSLFGSVTEEVLRNPIIQEITAIHKQFSEREMEEWTPDELSRQAGKLSTLLVNLGAMSVKTKSISDFAEDSIGTDLAKTVVEAIANGEAVTRAEAKAKAESGEMKKAIAIYKHKANFIQQLYRDTERFVSVIQSRLKTMFTGDKTGINI